AFDMTAGLPSGHHVESQIRPLGYPKKFTQVEFRSKSTFGTRHESGHFCDDCQTFWARETGEKGPKPDSADLAHCSPAG
ncbi:hypothetical protein, partial [Gluconacetobacter tumulicola]